MKVFWLQAKDPDGWLPPRTVVARLQAAFDHVETDWEVGRLLVESFVSKYRLLIKAGPGNANSTPLEVVERRWRDAVVVRVWDDADRTAPVEVVVQTGHRLELRFAPKTAFQRKRRTAQKIATALGYGIEHFDPDA